MKQVFDFVYCDGVLHPGIVWYNVSVGKSQRARRALRFVSELVRNDTRFLFCLHSVEIAEFKLKVAASFFSGRKPFSNMKYLRQAFIDIEKLASFLRRCPFALLNSEKKPTLTLTYHE